MPTTRRSQDGVPKKRSQSPRRAQSPKRAQSPSKSRNGSPSKSRPVPSDKVVPGKQAAKKAPATASGLEGDYGAIALLMLLYTLQGIPMGLGGSLPLLMAERKLSTAEQAVFSTVALPFAFKLLWAPLVDSVYSSAFGRRKTWIVPVQAAIGVLLIASAGRMDSLLGPVPEEGAAGSVDIKSLTGLFFAFYFLAATQDIAVDGLALTVLSERNKEYGATCNAIGQTLGYFLAYVGFLGLNAYGLATLGGFMAFWGWVFLGSTLWVLTVRRDEFVAPEGGVLGEMVAAYKEMVLVLQLPSVRLLTVVLLTCKAPLTAFDVLIPFELLSEPIKVPKEHLATLTTIMLPVGMLTQAYVSKLFTGSKPMSIWLLSYKVRLAVGFSLVGFVIALRQQTAGGAAIPPYMYAIGLAIMSVR